MGRKLLIIPLLLALGIAGYSGNELIQYSQESGSVKADLEEVRQLALAGGGTAATGIDFYSLAQINPDVIGWLHVPGTPIDYPVVQGPDNDYYLKRDFAGNETKYGSIFLDAASSLDPRDDNLILYGHHMKDGQMFGSLMDYTDEAFYRAHPVIEFTTPEEEAEYAIIAVFKTSVYGSTEDEYPYYSFKTFADEADWELFMSEIQSRSLYPIEGEVRLQDQLITLSTCEYTLDNGRLVIVARRRKS